MDIQSMDKPSVLLQLKRLTEQNLPIKGTYVKTLKQEDIFDSPVNKTTELHAVKIGKQQILVPIVKEEELTQGAISDDLVMKLLSKIKDKKSRQVLSAYIEQEQEIAPKPIMIAKDKTEKEGEETDETVLLKERKDEILKTARQFKTVKELMEYLETEKIEEFKKELKDNKLSVTLSALTRSINAIRKRLETKGYIDMKKVEEEEAKTKAKEEEAEAKRKVKQEEAGAKRKAKEEEVEAKRKAKEEEVDAKRKAKEEENEKKRKAKEQEEKEIQEALKFIEEPPKNKMKKKKQKNKSKKDVSVMTKKEVEEEIKKEKTKVMTKEEVKDEMKRVKEEEEKKEKNKVLAQKVLDMVIEDAVKKNKSKSKSKMTELQVKELKDAFIKNIKTIVKEKKIRNTKVLRALLNEKGYEALKEELIGAGFKSSATGLVKSINAIINSMAN
jgi:hypothetical protein